MHIKTQIMLHVSALVTSSSTSVDNVARHYKHVVMVRKCTGGFELTELLQRNSGKSLQLWLMSHDADAKGRENNPCVPAVWERVLADGCAWREPFQTMCDAHYSAEAMTVRPKWARHSRGHHRVCG